MTKKFFLLISFATAAATAMAAPSILDIKHSISDPNVVPPEGFEVKSEELDRNFFLNKYAQRPIVQDPADIATNVDYEQRLSALPAEIEMPFNPIVGKFIDMYLVKRRGLVADMIALHNYYGNIFAEELLKQNMPLELQYLPVIESAINPNAVSRAGAVGLWQFMPATATGLGLEINSLVDQRRDPRQSSRAAAKYLKQLHDIYGEWSLAIAAYNCGPGNVNKALRRAGGGKKDFWEIYTYLPQETRGYVPAFIAANYVMNYHNRHGIRPTVVTHPLVTDTVLVNQRVHFNQISSVLNIPLDEIRMLNPQFRKDIIPGDNHPYPLVLPSQQVLSYIMSEKDILAYDSLLYSRRTYVEPGTPFDPSSKADSLASRTPRTVYHTVKRGENLRDIAKKYGVSATDIKRTNHLRRGKVKAGDRLTIEIFDIPAPKSPADTTSVAKTAAEQPETPQNGSDIQQPQRQTQAPQASKPATPKTPKPQAAQKKHNVKKGDTLDKIARTYGTTAAEIRKANGMKPNDSRINIGQTLKIPAKAKSTPARKTSRRR